MIILPCLPFFQPYIYTSLATADGILYGCLCCLSRQYQKTFDRLSVPCTCSFDKETVQQWAARQPSSMHMAV